MNLDDAATSLRHRDIVQSKAFLRKVYEDHYQLIRQNLKSLPAGLILEIGSGGGFLKNVLPGCLGSDIVLLPDLNLVLNANAPLPFAEESLAAIVMVNVFHHLHRADLFLQSVSRCLKRGGRLVMIEPDMSLFGRMIWSRHHEFMDPKTTAWTLPPGGRLSQANIALPWIVFRRDIKLLHERFPQFLLQNYQPIACWRYLFSGGVSRPQFLPSPLYAPIKFIDHICDCLGGFFGLFCNIVIEKRSVP